MSEPPTPEPILELGFAFWGSKTLLSAVELGVFSALAKGPLDAEVLQRRLRLHPRAVRDFLDALVALGMLNRDDGRYSNTAATDLYLDRAKPSYVGGILEMANARLYGFWGALSEALRTGEPQNEAKHGQEFFATLYADPARLEGFLKAMTGVSQGAARAIAQKFPWKDRHSFADIGCAEGAVPVALARAHPHLAGFGFDLPVVQPHFEAYVAANGFSDRLRFQPGDCFADPLPTADVLIMGHMLHGWGLDRKMVLLGKAHEALPKGGNLVVYEAIIDDERRRNAFGLLMSLNMLIESRDGFDFTGADCVKWMRDAGFREARVEHLAGPDSMVVATK